MMKEEVKYVLNFIKPNYNLLDFGCGHGGLFSFLPNNINKFAVELNTTLFPHLNQEKIQTFLDINDLSIKMDYNYNVSCIRTSCRSC